MSTRWAINTSGLTLRYCCAAFCHTASPPPPVTSLSSSPLGNPLPRVPLPDLPLSNPRHYYSYSPPGAHVSGRKVAYQIQFLFVLYALCFLAHLPLPTILLLLLVGSLSYTREVCASSLKPSSGFTSWQQDYTAIFSTLNRYYKKTPKGVRGV